MLDSPNTNSRELIEESVMYRYSRAMYRDLLPYLLQGQIRPELGQRLLLSACERNIERLARDHRRFARPAASLFEDVRALFPVSRQLLVYDIIEAHMSAAMEFLDAEIAERGSADLLRCRATNRKGKACQRVPVTGSDYCPSHRYMEKLQASRADDMLAA
ncbi:MAG: hypothetical protein ISP32_06905 [Thermoleophilia bacterium]|nr:hypothetical protein [Thermoleophilia bacterium]